jgi:hypothetical protein
MVVTVVSSTSGDIRVHRAGCRDIERERRRANSVWNVEVPEGVTPAQAVSDEICADFGWTAEDGEARPWAPEDLTVLPCCKVVGR